MGTEIANLLINAGANVNQVNKNGGTPLQIAAERGRPGAVKLLLKQNADIQYTWEKKGSEGTEVLGENALLTARHWINHREEGFGTVEQYRSVIALLEKEALYQYSFNGQTDALAALLRASAQAGAGVNKKDGNGNTPLILAAACGRPGTVELLLKNNADIAQKAGDGKNALAKAQHWISFIEAEREIRGFGTVSEYQKVIDLLKTAEKD